MRLSLRSGLPTHMLRRTRSVLAVALVTAGAAMAAPLYNFTPVTNAMQAFVADHALDGASLRVNKAGSVVYRRAFGGYALTTRVPIASGSKWLSGLTVAHLVDKGTMRWTDTVGQYFPNAPADKKGITLAQLFSHTSALPDTDNLCMANPRITLGDCANTILANSTLIGTPGKVFAYGGNSMQVAGRMAEIASGKSWDDLFIAETATPLGLTQTDYAYDSTVAGYVRMANPRIAEGGRSTLEDYGHVVDMLLANGRYNGKPAAVVEPRYPYYPDDAQTSTFGPAPGLVPGGPNAYYSGSYTIPLQARPAYAYRDFSVGCDWSGSACRASCACLAISDDFKSSPGEKASV